MPSNAGLIQARTISTTALPRGHFGGRGLLRVEAPAATWSCTGDARGRTVRATFPPRTLGGSMIPPMSARRIQFTCTRPKDRPAGCPGPVTTA